MYSREKSMKKLIKLIKSLAIKTKEKIGKVQITNARNGEGDITIDHLSRCRISI